jgi:DNA-directed RNA polymerase specialized sigma24 family protein
MTQNLLNKELDLPQECYIKRQSSHQSQLCSMSEEEKISLTLAELLKTLLKETQGSDEYNRIAEILANLIVDFLPEIKVFLDKGLLPYYEEATKNMVTSIMTKLPDFVNNNQEEIKNCKNVEDLQLLRKQLVSFMMIIVKRRCIEIWRKYNKTKNPAKKTPKSLDEPNKNDPDNLTLGDTLANQNLEGIEKIIEEKRLNIGRKIEEYIETDPEDKLKNCYVRGRQDVNCQILLKLRLLEDYTLQEIADYFQPKVPLQTIKSRFDRNCFPMIQKIAIAFGYEKDILN